MISRKIDSPGFCSFILRYSFITRVLCLADFNFAAYDFVRFHLHSVFGHFSRSADSDFKTECNLLIQHLVCYNDCCIIPDLGRSRNKPGFVK